MKPVRQKNTVFLAVIISFWVLLFFAYAHSYNLAEAHFLCTSPHLESPFLEGFLPSLKGKWEFIEGHDLPMFFVREKRLSGHCFPLTFQNLFSLEENSSLRC